MRNLDRKSLAVLVIAYKRIYNTKTILDFSYSQGIRKFYICIDGPKDSNFDTQNQFQDMISSFSLNYGIDIKTKFSKYNLLSLLNLLHDSARIRYCLLIYYSLIYYITIL